MSSFTIVDSDTINLSFIEDPHNLTGPPATTARVTMAYHQTLANGISNANVTMAFWETFGNGNPDARATMQFWQTLVSVNHSTQMEPDTLNLSFTETITKFIKDTDTINLSFIDSQPAFVSDIHPTIIPIGQTFVLMYVIGFGFTEGATIVFNGTPLETTFVSPMELTAKVPHDLISPLGTIQVYVSE